MAASGPVKFRQVTVIAQDVLSEGGRELASPCRRVAACGVLPNPFAGKPTIDDFTILVDLSAEAGKVLTARALKALGALKHQRPSGLPTKAHARVVRLESWSVS
jgi:hypothetical protein